VIVEHAAGLVSVSGGLERRTVAVGERVEAGRILGTVGEARSFDGAGLYFELRRDALPVDPEPWFEPGAR
jgi:murein hydrolase activator